MNHAVANFHSGGKTVMDQTSDFGLQERRQLLEPLQVCFGGVKRGRQLALQIAGNIHHFIVRRATHDQRRRAENLLAELIVTEERFGIGDKEHGR